MKQFYRVYERFDNLNLPVYAIEFDSDNGKYNLFRKLHADELAMFVASEFSCYIVDDYIFLHSEENIDDIENAIFRLWRALDGLG